MGENGSFQGLWIPREILLLPISITQKVLLAEFLALNKSNGCFASNQYLADFMQLSVDSIKKHLRRLKAAGYIDIQGGNYSRYIVLNKAIINGGKNSPNMVENLPPTWWKKFPQHGGKSSPNGGKSSPNGGKSSPNMVEKITHIEYRENIEENIEENIAGGSGSPDSAPPNTQPNIKNQNKGNVSSILGEPEDIQTCTERASEWTRERALKYAQVRWQSIQGLDITPFQADFIARQLLKFGKLWVDKAFEELLFKGNEIQGNKFSYLRRMLESWEESGSKEPWKSRLRAKESGQSNGMAVQPQSTGDGFAVFGKSGSYGNSKLDICRQVYEMAGGMDGDDE